LIYFCDFSVYHGGFVLLHGGVYSVFSSNECSWTIHFNLFLGAKETYVSIV